MKDAILYLCLFFTISSLAQPAVKKEGVGKIVDAEYSSLEQLYKTLHEHPELALQEKD
jgi:hypothetical protein